MKKLVVVAVALVVALCACNRVAFVKKIEGTWKLSKYLYAGQNKTASFDTSYYGYQLVIGPNYVYNETYKSFSFRADSLIKQDTLGFDSASMTFHIQYDTLRFVDTTIHPYAFSGTWTLINSEEDLQLRSDGGGTDSSVRIFNILKLTNSNLNLLNGNKEYDLTK